MKYLVTGGCGFVGSHLVEELVSLGHDVTVIDDLSNGKMENLSKIIDKIYVIPADINNLEIDLNKWFRENHAKDGNFDFDGIFHLATHPRSFSLKDPKRDIEVNCKGMISVLDLAKKCKAKVVFTSNSGIYGSGANVDETFRDNPLTPYDTNKLASEWYGKIYHSAYGLEVAIVRFATVYGFRQVVNEKLNWKPLVSTFVQSMITGKDITINDDGEQTRDLLYVKDAVQGVIKAMNSNVVDGNVCLISTHVETSVNEVFDIIKKLTGYTKDPIYNEPLLGDIRRMCLNNTKAKETIGFEPKYNAYDGIKELVEQSMRDDVDITDGIKS